MNSVIALCKRCWGARSKKAVQLLGGLFAVLLLCLPAFSQGSFGRILGTVTDQSGGVVAGATVTVIDTERGITRTLTTDDAGAYNAPNLTAGNYTVRVEAKGFKRIERQGIAIEVGHEVRVDLTVQPGEQNQTVTVTESVPLVETTNATQGGTLENADIIDLPLNGRDYQNLLGLRPGVMLQPGGGPWTQSTNGVRPDESVWLIEGIINANFFDARPVINMPSPFTDGATILPVDAIQEFNLHGKSQGGIRLEGRRDRECRHQVGNQFASRRRVCVRPLSSLGRAERLQRRRSHFRLPDRRKRISASRRPPNWSNSAPWWADRSRRTSSSSSADMRACVPSSGSWAVLRFPLPRQWGIRSKSMVDAITAMQNAGIHPEHVSLKLAGCTAGATPVCTGNLFPNSGTSNSFLSTFPTINTSDNGVGKLDYHPNDKNSFNGMFFYGHYNAMGEDHASSTSLRRTIRPSARCRSPRAGSTPPTPMW